jgi:RNA polymerase II subunit A small phosphatase-like protein
MSDRKDKLLILDLDETLIYASEQPLSRPADFLAGQYHVYKRPFLNEFLSACRGWFEVAVWTSGSKTYAARITESIFPPGSGPSFVWSAERCTWAYDPELMEYYWRKNLKKVRRKGYDLSRVIVVDDRPAGLRQSYGNLIQVSPYDGDEGDDELRVLLPYLDRLRRADNIRATEKRGWKAAARRELSGEQPRS